MAVQERLYTVAEFLEIAQLPENEDKRLELDEGVIVEMPPSSQKNSVIAGRIIYYLNAFVIPNNLGYVTVPDGGFKLAENTVRQPDVAFISRERHPALEGVEFPVAPDLAVEVVSPNENIMKKVRQYIAAGTRLVWTAYADDRMVYAWTAAPDGGLHVREYGIDDTLDGGDVLAGFRLAVKDVFGVEG